MSSPAIIALAHSQDSEMSPLRLEPVLSRQIVIIGTGGHSHVIAELASLSGHEIAGFLEPTDRGAMHHEGRRVFHSLPNDEEFSLVSAIGDNMIRKRTVEMLNSEIDQARCEWSPALVHPSAIVSPTASLAHGTAVLAGSVVGPNARVGRHCIVNSHAVVEHDCTLENFSSVAPAAIMGGASRLAEGAFLGMNSTLLQGRSIGAWSIVGAGSLVLRRVPENRLVFGIPALDRRAVVPGDSPFGSDDESN